MKKKLAVLALIDPVITFPRSALAYILVACSIRIFTENNAQITTAVLGGCGAEIIYFGSGCGSTLVHNLGSAIQYNNLN